MKLIIPSYPGSGRTGELLYCLSANLEVFDEVILVGEPWEVEVTDPKLTVVILDHRPTIAEMIAAAGVTAGDVFVIANADIEWDAVSVALAAALPVCEAYALSMWEGDPLKLVPRSNDSWVLRAPVTVAADFELGRPFCHLCFQWLLDDAGLVLSNPCREIVTIHRHASQVRTYTREDVVRAPVLEVPPDHLQVPAEIASWRAKAVLRIAGLTAAVDALIEAMPEPGRHVVQAAWSGDAIFARTGETIVTLGAALGLTPKQLDAMFIQAAALEV